MSRRVMVLGVGAFAHAVMAILKDSGAETGCYLTRSYGHFGPKSVGQTWNAEEHPSPLDLIDEFCPDLIIPMSIAWAEQPWSKTLVDANAPLLSAVGEAMQIEISRDHAAQLCRQHGISVPDSYLVQNREEAIELIRTKPGPYVLKNPICSPFSPLHTIVCETVEDTLGWLNRADDSEGLFLQEFMGNAEIGHFVFISGGQILSLVTNQEYKRAFTGNMGPVAGAPLGGIAEADPDDRYGLAKQLIHPLKPWFDKTGYYGPLQVTAILRNGTWHAVEYNIRLGVTTAALLLRMLDKPMETLIEVANNRIPSMEWNQETRYGCTITLAGQGYPYVVPSVPRLPVDIRQPLDCDLWWNEVDGLEGKLCMASHHSLDKGHRICDVNACAAELDHAVAKVYENIARIRCLGSYYRLDLGQSLWPPGRGF